MKTSQLGRTNEELTVLGLGTWAIGGGNWQYGWGPQDDEDSIRTIHCALECGINWIDTAPVYGLGRSEEVVGRAIRGITPKPFIATKCGLVWDQKRRVTQNLSRASVTKEIEASLTRLQVDVIDLYQIHWPYPDAQIEEAWEVIARAVDKGMIRYAGVSNFNVSQMKRAQSIHPIASLQPPYNILNRDIEDEMLPYCKGHNIGVIAYSPMERGLLTGKFTWERIQQLADDDHRKKSPAFNEPRLTPSLDLVENMRPLAEKHGITLAQLAIAWVLRRPEITAAIVGSRKPEQIEENVHAADSDIPEEDFARIDELSRTTKEFFAKI